MSSAPTSATTALDVAIEQATDEIMSARDFCGDEQQAAREALLECGFTPSPDRLARAFGQANRQWRACQQQAGVGVAQRITSGERQRIERSLS